MMNRTVSPGRKEDAMSEPNMTTVSVDRAAEILGISRTLAYDSVKRGLIPALHFGTRRLRIPVSALQKMLDTANQPKN